MLESNQEAITVINPNKEDAKSIRTALLVGASGLVGSYCLSELLRLEIYQEVYVLARRELYFDLPDEQKKK